MKTSKLTKKDIRAIIRTENATAIFQACKTVTGSASYCAVRKFIEDYAPTAALRDKAYSLSYGAARNQRPTNEDQETKARQFRNGNRRHIVMQLFRSELARGLDSHTKRPVPNATRRLSSLRVSIAATGRQSSSFSFICPFFFSKNGAELTTGPPPRPALSQPSPRIAPRPPCPSSSP